MYIDTTGHGPPLILIHGWAMHSGIFAPLTERLAADFTVYLVDLPGHGWSTQRAGPLSLEATAAELLLRLPVAPWMGWSLGGLLALEAARQQPQRVSALLPLCASPCFVTAADWPHAVAVEVFEQFGRDLGQDYRGTIDRFLALEAHGSDHMRNELRELRQHVFDRGEPAAHVLADGLQILEHGDLRAPLPSLQMPALWLGGRRDRLVPWQAMHSAAAAMPNGKFQRIEGGGHAPFLSHAREVAEAARAFLTST